MVVNWQIRKEQVAINSTKHISNKRSCNFLHSCSLTELQCLNTLLCITLQKACTCKMVVTVMCTTTVIESHKLFKQWLLEEIPLKKSMTSSATVCKKMHMLGQGTNAANKILENRKCRTVKLYNSRVKLQRGFWTKHMSFVTHRCQHDQIRFKSLGWYSSEHQFNSSTDKILHNLIIKFSII